MARVVPMCQPSNIVFIKSRINKFHLFDPFRKVVTVQNEAFQVINFPCYVDAIIEVLSKQLRNINISRDMFHVSQVLRDLLFECAHAFICCRRKRRKPFFVIVK